MCYYCYSNKFGTWWTFILCQSNLLKGERYITGRSFSSVFCDTRLVLCWWQGVGGEITMVRQAKLYNRSGAVQGAGVAVMAVAAG